MKNTKRFLSPFWSVLMVLMGLAGILSCGGSRHSHGMVENQNWIAWDVQFKSGTSERQMKKTIAEMEKSILESEKNQNPPSNINFHTLIVPGNIVRITASSMQGSNPRPGGGGPHHPPGFEGFLHFKGVDNIRFTEGVQSGMLR
ncbi:MAG: hypothetical protein ABIY90_09835 [Puia sp.]